MARKDDKGESAGPLYPLRTFDFFLVGTRSEVRVQSSVLAPLWLYGNKQVWTGEGP